MSSTRARLYRALVIYYALVQIVHLISIGWEGAHYLRTGSLALLAPPPAAGWSGPAMAALLAMGLADAILVLASLAFAWGVLRDRAWSRPLGAVVLLAFMATALAFAVVTLPTGVWSVHRVYLIEGVLFLPIAALALVHLGWVLGAEGKQERADQAG